jgi:hypothetical protein
MFGRENRVLVDFCRSTVLELMSIYRMVCGSVDVPWFTQKLSVAGGARIRSLGVGCRFNTWCWLEDMLSFQEKFSGNIRSPCLRGKSSSNKKPACVCGKARQLRLPILFPRFGAPIILRCGGGGGCIEDPSQQSTTPVVSSCSSIGSF